ncbi:MAG: glycosyltransferase [Actinomycetota bacterium]
MARVTICTPCDWPLLELPASLNAPWRWIPGGYRTLHELAFAARAAGHDVELRGAIHEPTFRALADATGVEPRRATSGRAPDAGEIVVLPEGIAGPVPFASVSLSPARAVLLVLAPPGLVGWPFDDGWTRPDPATVPFEALARAEHFRAMRAAGFALWSNSQQLAHAAADAGVACTWLGAGLPRFPAPPRERTHDVAVVVNNRWGTAASAIAEELGASTLPIDQADNDEMLAMLSRAHVLLWPGRVEGSSRVVREAQLVGTVPVTLASNPFGDRLDEEDGGIMVDDASGFAAAVDKLLSDPSRLARLSSRAVDSARARSDWPAYVARVAEAIRALRDDDGAPARTAFGGAFVRAMRADAATIEEQQGLISAARAEIARLASEARSLEKTLAAERAHATLLGSKLQRSEERYNTLASRRLVRVGVGVKAGFRRMFSRGNVDER